MILYRTQSHRFKFVDATFAGKNTGFVLRFYGGDATQPPVALYFRLVDKQPVLRSGVLKGHMINKEDSLVRLNLELSFKNAGSMALSDHSSCVAPNG